MADLKLAFETLKAKQTPYTNLFRYYDGQQPIVYSTKRLEQVFGTNIQARFSENWCAVVVDSVLDRIVMQPPEVRNDTGATDRLTALWAGLDMALEAETIHEDALVTGESFMIVWPNAETEAIEAFHNDSRMCCVEYEMDNPRKKRMGAKWWVDADGYRRLTLYYPDRLEYYISSSKAEDVTNDKNFRPIDDMDPVVENPFGAIPVFHFRTHRRGIKSELASVIEPQDAVNKLLNDMMVAAEFGAFPQRWAITATGIDDLKNAPNHIWDLPAGLDGEQPTSVGEFSAAQLNNYLEAINKLSADIGIITRTPRHYFYNQGGDPSGEALIAMEAPLNKKTQKRVDNMSVTWRNVVQFLLRLDGIEVDPTAIAIKFDKPETIQPRTEAEIRKLAIEAGIPLATQLREEGRSDEWLQQMEQDKTQAEASGTNLAAAMLSNAQRQFDQNGANG